MARPPLFTTPAGVAVYPHLHAPDTKFNSAGEYKTGLRFSGEDASALREQLTEKAEEAYQAEIEALIEKGKAKTKAAAEKLLVLHVPFEEVLDDDGEETGDIIVNFKMKASGERKDKTRWTNQPAIFDASGQPVKKGLKIGGGSTLRISYALTAFSMKMVGTKTFLTGVSPKLYAVQVISLETWGGRSAAGFGFDAEDEGFSASEAADEYFAGTEQEEAAGDDDFSGEESDEDGEESDGADF